MKNEIGKAHNFEQKKSRKLRKSSKIILKNARKPWKKNAELLENPNLKHVLIIIKSLLF